MYRIKKQDFSKIIDELIKTGNRIISYSNNGNDFKRINSSNELSINSNFKPSKLSLKEIVFPKTEPLFYYKRTNDNVELKDIKFDSEKTIIIGAKPCDAKAFSTISKVFNWDYKDNFFNSKYENTIIIGLKCDYKDEYCFCNEVGLSQSSKEGSDIFIELDGDDYFIYILSEKGKNLLQPFMSYLIEEIKESKLDDIDKIIDLNKVRTWITDNFDNNFWYSISQECLGCGKCAFICPTCHCFDIVDENYTYFEGRRMKNWDACQFGKFTLHASGHNPRDIQAKRYRQRIAHKFKYYFDKFDELLCTGCGRCSRECPVSINIFDVIKEINAK